MRPLRLILVAFERNRVRERPVLVHQPIDWDQRLDGTNLEKIVVGEEKCVFLESNRQSILFVRYVFNRSRTMPTSILPVTLPRNLPLTTLS